MKRALNDRRLVIAMAGLALITAILLGARWAGTRGEVRDTASASSSIREEIAALEERMTEVEAARAAPQAGSHGHGPGGIRAEEERWFFEGPTAASAALDLITAADRAGFRHLSYDGQDTAVWGTFPPDDVEGLPVRSRVEIVRWPVRFRLESSYQSALDFLKRLFEAEPGFALDGVNLEVARDSRGDVQDRVLVTGLVSSHWFSEEGSHGE